MHNSLRGNEGYMTQTSDNQNQAARENGKTMQSASRLIAILSLCWLMILGSVALIFLIPRQPVAMGDATDALLLSKPFPLDGELASSFTVVGTTLVRIEDEGLALLDASGREQSFIGFPYRESRVITMKEGLIVTPVRGSGFMVVTPDLSTYEIDAPETVHGADYRDGQLLTFGPSSQNRIVVALYEIAAETNRRTLSFPSAQWPVRVAFVPDGQFFDVVLLDLSNGTLSTRLQRYDYACNQVMDLLYDEEDLFPGIGHLADRESILYNDRAIMLTDTDSGEVRVTAMPGSIEHVDLMGGRYAMLSEKEGKSQFSIVLPSVTRGDHILFEPELSDQIICFALARSGSLALAASDGELLVYDMNTGALIVRMSIESDVRRILALDDRSFVVISTDDAIIAIVR